MSYSFLKPGTLTAMFVVSVAVMVTLMSLKPVHGVPARVGNRMIPSWWYSGKLFFIIQIANSPINNNRRYINILNSLTAKNICYAGSDCGPGECCARPMLSANSYCMPMKRRGDVCDSSPLMLYPDAKVLL